MTRHFLTQGLQMRTPLSGGSTHTRSIYFQNTSKTKRQEKGHKNPNNKHRKDITKLILTHQQQRKPE